jgi:hypothetical protein
MIVFLSCGTTLSLHSLLSESSTEQRLSGCFCEEMISKMVPWVLRVILAICGLYFALDSVLDAMKLNGIQAKLLGPTSV